MTISIGSTIPDVTVHRMGSDGPEAVSTRELFDGRKVALFAVPGAFTPTCSKAHLPGFVAQADKLLAKGLDAIICLSVNDVFVMNAWGEQNNAEYLTMIADGVGEFTRAVGMDQDLTARGLGLRSERYAMIVDNGTVTFLAHEEPGKFEVSSAEAVLAQL